MHLIEKGFKKCLKINFKIIRIKESFQTNCDIILKLIAFESTFFKIFKITGENDRKTG